MICPKCNGKVIVADKVDIYSNNEIYRKRTCTACGHTFYTTEKIVEQNKEFLDNWSCCHR